MPVIHCIKKAFPVKDEKGHTRDTTLFRSPSIIEDVILIAAITGIPVELPH
jgi:hypothetical protein